MLRTTHNEPSKLARRELIRDTQRTDVPTLPILAIRGYLCFRCLEHTPNLVRCGACRRAVYCSIDCQLADWHIAHKNHCAAFQKVNAVDKGDAVVRRTWSSHKRALVRATRTSH